jgi:opacity protein-like surface antigen
MKKCVLAAAMLATSVSAGVSATENNYFGANFIYGIYSEDGFPDLNPKALSLKLGHNISEHIAGELRAGTGVASDSAAILIPGYYTVNAELSIKNIFGAYVKAKTNNEKANVYGIAGVTRATIEANVSGFTESDSDSDLSLGLGADIDISKKSFFNLEYMRYIDKDGGSLSGFSLGLGMKF